MHMITYTVAAHLEHLCVKSRFQLFEASLVHKNVTLCTVTFGEKVLTLIRAAALKCAATIYYSDLVSD